VQPPASGRPSDDQQTPNSLLSRAILTNTNPSPRSPPLSIRQAYTRNSCCSSCRPCNQVRSTARRFLRHVCWPPSLITTSTPQHPTHLEHRPPQHLLTHLQAILPRAERLPTTLFSFYQSFNRPTWMRNRTTSSTPSPSSLTSSRSANFRLFVSIPSLLTRFTARRCLAQTERYPPPVYHRPCSRPRPHQR
jgi:hypothetical protein